MPVQLTNWLLVALKLALPFISGGYLLTRILAHSVCLSGQRTSDDKDGIACRFALQNNEEGPLSGNQKLVIRILNEGGQFEPGSAVTVYAGCNKIRSSFDPGRKIWTMWFNELPAYDTWTIDCRMNHEARDVEVSIQEDGSSLIRSPFLSHDRLVLTADRSSTFAGNRTTPEVWWAVLATGLALLAYTADAVDFTTDLSRMTGMDWAAEGAIALFALALYLATRRHSTAITQGYWQPTVTEPAADAVAKPAPAAQP